MSDDQSNLSSLWAKDTGYTLLNHSLDVMHLAEHICAMLPFPPDKRRELARAAKELAALHDVGKAASGFQNMLKGKAESWKRRHEILSAAVAAQIAADISDEGLLAVITHHRNIPSAGNLREPGEKCLPSEQLPFIAPNLFGEMVDELKGNKSLLEKLLEILSQELGANWEIDLLNFEAMNLQRLDNGWLQRSKGIGQRDRIAKEKRRLASELRGVLITSDHIASAMAGKADSSRYMPLPPSPLHSFDEQLGHHELKGKPPLPFQAKCAETFGNAILKSPTGSGKTAGVLSWAARNQAENGRLFYVLPHTASINAMHKRLQKIYPQDAVGVLHHKSASYLFRLYESELTSKDAARMAKTVSGLARELYHPIRVTTPHQILRVALHGRGWELGLLEFPNACFVFDEIHVFEPLLMGLTVATAKWLQSLGARLLFASATIPQFMEKILREELQIPETNIISPDPALPGDREVCNKKRHKIEVRSGSLLNCLPMILEEIIASNETALIVCNHVATSQQVFARVVERFGADSMLLHSRFNSRDRAWIEAAITGTNPPKALVATQAVEVSLDLDYDRGYSEPAPADALGQRLGRINRSGSRPPVPVVIFDEPSNGYLYDEKLTRNTIALLGRVDELTEQQLTEIVNDVYGEGYQGDALTDYQRGLTNTTIRKFESEIIAGAHQAWVEKVIENSDGQIEVLPIEGVNEYNETYSILEEFKRHYKSGSLLQAKELLVPIRIGQWHKMKNEKRVYFDEGIREWCTTLKYNSRIGLDLTQQIGNIF